MRVTAPLGGGASCARPPDHGGGRLRNMWCDGCKARKAGVLERRRREERERARQNWPLPTPTDLPNYPALLPYPHLPTTPGGRTTLCSARRIKTGHQQPRQHPEHPNSTPNGTPTTLQWHSRDISSLTQWPETYDGPRRNPRRGNGTWRPQGFRPRVGTRLRRAYGNEFTSKLMKR